MFSSRAQLKIQEMAFVLLAVMIFFALAGLFYFSVRSSSIQKSAQSIFETNAKSQAIALAKYPELIWGECQNCIDLDKAIVFKEQSNSTKYSKFWELDYLMLERVYPKNQDKECLIGNYPICSKITLINTNSNFGAVSYSFVNLCRFDAKENEEICELGKIYLSGKNAGAKK